MICDIHARLKDRARTPVTRIINPVMEASASHKLRDGRRVTCSVRINERQPKSKLFYEWFIDGIAVDETIAKCALAND